MQYLNGFVRLLHTTGRRNGLVISDPFGSGPISGDGNGRKQQQPDSPTSPSPPSRIRARLLLNRKWSVALIFVRALFKYFCGDLSLKIILPHGFHGKAMFDLRTMNITSASLFPGLDGFARSLTQSLRPV